MAYQMSIWPWIQSGQDTGWIPWVGPVINAQYIARNSRWINLLWFNQPCFMNWTIEAMTEVSEQLHATSQMATHNRFTFEALLAPKHRVCTGEECCTVMAEKRETWLNFWQNYPRRTHTGASLQSWAVLLQVLSSAAAYAVATGGQPHLCSSSCAPIQLLHCFFFYFSWSHLCWGAQTLPGTIPTPKVSCPLRKEPFSACSGGMCMHKRNAQRGKDCNAAWRQHMPSWTDASFIWKSVLLSKLCLSRPHHESH